MHDCHKMKPRLLELVFAELDAGPRPAEVAEMRACPVCSEEYQSMLATLRIADQAAEAVEPEESYWIGYEARLRAKLAASVEANRRERLAAWWGNRQAWFSANLVLPAGIAAVLLLVIAGARGWFLQRDGGKQPVLAVKTTPAPQSSPIPGAQDQAGPNPQFRREPSPILAGKGHPLRRPHPPRQVEKPASFPPDDASAADELSVVAPASHFEKAQLLLRSFRNSRNEETGSVTDLAYEKRTAGKLIYDNILLRREAEAKGNLPVEETLNSLEPLLLDIANLPDKPSRGDVQAIRQRIQKQEIIATLQIVSSETERFSPPALLTPQ